MDADNTYVCEQCHETFAFAWPDDDALSEMKERFGDMSTSQRAIVCDDCYHLLMAIWGN